MNFVHNCVKLSLVAAASVSMAAQVYAAPMFTPGVMNEINFSAVANDASGGAVSVGDVFYGVVNAQAIKNLSTGLYTWNANNSDTSRPYDSMTGYFAAQVTDISSFTDPLGGVYKTYTMGALTSAFGLFDATDVANQTLVKFYTDTVTPFTTGNVASDIAHATDGAFWGSLGFAGGGYWVISDSPIASGSRGAVNFIANNSGLNWGKTSGPCLGGGSCLFDMTFSTSFAPTGAGSAWGYDVNDPARVVPSAVPVPAAAWLLGSGLLGLGGLARRKQV